MSSEIPITVGVLALQGAFNEHIQLLREAAQTISLRETESKRKWKFTFSEIRNKNELATCDALIIPGGESTAISLVAERCGMLEPLREFVKVSRNPTWGTCAGLILLAESANTSSTKLGGQSLIGGLDVRVNRNHFGRQTESFQANLFLPFLSPTNSTEKSEESSSKEIKQKPFRAIFIRAPIVEKVLSPVQGIQAQEASKENIIVAPSKEMTPEIASRFTVEEVEVLGRLDRGKEGEDEGEIIAVRQGNCFGTSFHPELTGDERIHVWWLEGVVRDVVGRRGL
ncbi:hypothetical protein HYALB_00010307 [Hymenoscyphus albidus]|uniref:glutaminase n=1 Tax=Hymenoscyphus albidus TaxID=595503 RepID=A0A9N9QCH3_9HELO|nr:hypothetical protein HYALB_00010307 [Hymenoscyphus albidus]